MNGEKIMSQNLFFKNMDKNEYVYGSGNGNFNDTLRYDNPLFIVWVIMQKWSGDTIMCFAEHEMPNGYKDILCATDKTKEYRDQFEER